MSDIVYNTCPEFPHFGAKYPDARCIDGYLWDLDSSENDDGGQFLTVGGDDPCPFCNTEEYIENVVEHYGDNAKEDALKYIEYLRNKYK
jgi:hypothetical protein